MTLSLRPIPMSLLVLLLLALHACNDTSPIIIGFSGQLTGKLSDLGIHARNGAELAVETINTLGGINGRKLKLIAKDDGNSPETALKVDQTLVADGAIAVIGHMTSSQTAAVLPFFNKSKRILLSPTTSSPAFTGKKDALFRMTLDNSNQSRELAIYARAALDVKTAIVVADIDNQCATLPFIESFTDQFEANGGHTLARVTFSSKNFQGWDEVIQKLMRLKPQAILLACSAYDAVSLIQRIRKSKLNPVILSGDWAYTNYLLNWGGQDVEGIYFATDYTTDNPKTEYIKFRESYKNRFGSNPNYAAAFSYEAVMTLATALKKNGGAADGLAEVLSTSGPYTGITSDYTLDSYGDVIRDMYILTVLNGEFRTVEMR